MRTAAQPTNERRGALRGRRAIAERSFRTGAVGLSGSGAKEGWGRVVPGSWGWRCPGFTYSRCVSSYRRRLELARSNHEMG
jgi:hypothetical protein